MAKSNHGTPQEEFWAGNFGTDYIARNRSEQLLASNLQFFSRALQQAGAITSCLELGANIGMNLRALKLLYPSMAMAAAEVNPEAARQLAEFIGPANVFAGSLYDYPIDGTVDLTLSKGVLIHLHPDKLATAYDKLYLASHRYVLVCEYYNPSPVAIPYRGHSDRLFKRDFAGEMLDAYPALKLVDYGFSYRRDPAFPQDDITWFLLEKNA
ncbi:MAG: pseudaminic acid biosynthesis-associated methylase [Vicinamibacterales bacterium]|jgi:spore coat polysaccharide biosynthesis protein SpsF